MQQREDESQADTSGRLGVPSATSTDVVVAKSLSCLLITFKCNSTLVKTSLLLTPLSTEPL